MTERTTAWQWPGYINGDGRSIEVPERVIREVLAEVAAVRRGLDIRNTALVEKARELEAALEA